MTPARTVLLATRSEGKRRELLQLLSPLGVRVVTLGEAAIAETRDEGELEAFDSFEENALAKARHFHACSGLPAIADDSGLEVFALGNRPGVRSKRWSGRDDLTGRALDDANNDALLRALAGVRARRARFVCVVAFVSGEQVLVRRGETEGAIVDVPVGSRGFGYDPLFLSDELARTFGEVSAEEKAAVGHRGRALRALREALRAWLDEGAAEPA